MPLSSKGEKTVGTSNVAVMRLIPGDNLENNLVFVYLYIYSRLYPFYVKSCLSTLTIEMNGLVLHALN